MERKNNKILEALQMQPLSQEEMTARHILGRMYGPIATCVESTRNGRLYNKPLWEKALEDDIFLEKVATKALFLELGHPADREETDMKQTCACIPEVPKIVGDDLYAYVDILDTPNGRLLKTLVDYGFVPGISSRGSGDVMDNNQVDPETFFLETWDIVQLPAVKKARLNICESLDSDGVKLRKALAESYNAAKDEDKDAMKKALENLNIDIEEEIASKEVLDDEVKVILTDDDIPWDDSEDDVLVEEAAEENDADAGIKEDSSDDEPATDDENVSEQDIDNEKSADEFVDVDSTEELAIDTVGDAVEMLQDFDSDVKIEVEPVEIDGEEHTVDGFTFFVDDDGDDDTLVIGVTCESDGDMMPDDAEENIEAVEEPAVEDVDEAEYDENSADDDGDVEVIESLKDMIRQKEALETEVKSLRKAKTVGDAKEQELQEKLTRYRTAFRSTSAEAAKVPELQAMVQELTEKLTQSKTTIKTLTEKVNNARQLKESIEGSKATEKRLNESVNRLTEANKTLEAKLEGQTKQYTQKLQERTNLAKTYKARLIETLNKYIESKASMLGVRPSEITSRLNENYSLADVDAVCDQILESTVSISRLPFGGRSKTSARISESVSRVSRFDSEYGYDIDDSLLELAGLKK